MAVVSLSIFSPLFSSSASALGVFAGSADYYLYRNSAGRPFFKWYNDIDCKQGVSSYSLSSFNPSNPKPLRVYDSNTCYSYMPTLPAGSIIELNLVTRNLQFDSQVYTDANNRFLGVSLNSFDNAGSYDYWTIYLYSDSTISNAYIYVNQYWVPYTSSSDVYFGVNSWSVWAPTVGVPDYSSALNTINNSLNSVNNNLQGIISGVGGVQDSVNSAANQAHQDSQAEIDAINEQTQQQQSQYEDEKAEESQREDDMDSQASQAESMFSFTFLNPFIGIFELFNDSGCVSIPTIAGMVGSDETTYCPWFDSSVRNILTPVIGLSSSMLLFGFVIRGFLNKGNFSGGIEV